MTTMSRSGTGCSALLLLVAVLAAAQAGCSFAFVKGPPPPPSEEPVPITPGQPPCTRVNVVPVLDAVAGIFAGSVMVVSVIGTPPPDQTPEERQARDHDAKTVALSALVIGAVAGASAIYGFYTAHECRLYLRAARFRRDRASNGDAFGSALAPPSIPIETPAASGAQGRAALNVP